MPSKEGPFTLEENLVLTNEELKSNISKLASFIRAFEGCEWKVAQEKSGRLLRESKADDYIESVRKTVKEGKAIPAESKASLPVLPKKDKTIYERNYDRLLEIVPGLEEKLKTFKLGDELYGKSESRGYMDFSFEVLYKHRGSFYLSLAHYYLQNGDLVPDPMMEVRLDPERKLIEAVAFQDSLHYAEVYDDKFDRQRVSKSEKASQNKFLTQWLKNLKEQDHRVLWGEDEVTGVAQSPIITLPTQEKSKSNTKAKDKIEPDELVADNSGKKSDAKIVSLTKAEDNQRAYLHQLLKVVDFTEFKLESSENELHDRVMHIIEHVGVPEYLLEAWKKLFSEYYDKLKALNYLQFNAVLPDLHDQLKDSGERIPLISNSKQEAFSVALGEVKQSKVTFAFYDTTGKDQDRTLLLTIDNSAMTLSVDLIMNGFMGMQTFQNQKDDALNQIRSAKASSDVYNWLKLLLTGRYQLKLPASTPIDEGELKEVDPSQLAAQSTQVKEVVPEPEHDDDHYINKDIPDFEPGHVQLVEAHIKRGVTQGIIDRINATGEGVTILPRRQKMVYNTKSTESDRNQHAERPGFRLSRTGKFYTEGRSNRADRGTDGL